MAGPFTEAWLGYTKETTYGTRIRAGTVANTTTKVYGAWKGPFPLVQESPKIIEYQKSGSFDPATLAYGNREVRFQLPSNLLDPVRILEQVYGQLATTGPVSGIYTHTITGTEPSEGAVLPSRTYHKQTSGLTTDFILDISGCYVEEVNFGYVAGDPGVECLEKILAQRVTDENATSDIAGVASASDEDDAKAYTNDPTLGTGVTEEDPFYLSLLSESGNDIVDDVLAVNIKVKNTFKENRTARPSGYNNYGHNINGYLSSAYYKSRSHEVTLDLKPTDATLAFWDKLQSHSLDTDLIIKFKRQTKTNDKEHTMDWTFDTDVCPVKNISGMIPFLHNEMQKWIVTLKPKTIVNVVCKDESANTD